MADNCPKPADFPAFEKLIFALISARMDHPTSENRQHGTTFDQQLDDPTTQTSRLGEMNGFDIELEFLEDKENRWNKIFELLEGEDYAQ